MRYDKTSWRNWHKPPTTSITIELDGVVIGVAQSANMTITNSTYPWGGGYSNGIEVECNRIHLDMDRLKQLGITDARELVDGAWRRFTIKIGSGDTDHTFGGAYLESVNWSYEYGDRLIIERANFVAGWENLLLAEPPIDLHPIELSPIINGADPEAAVKQIVDMTELQVELAKPLTNKTLTGFTDLSDRMFSTLTPTQQANAGITSTQPVQEEPPPNHALTLLGFLGAFTGAFVTAACEMKEPSVRVSPDIDLQEGDVDVCDHTNQSQQ